MKKTIGCIMTVFLICAGLAGSMKAENLSEASSGNEAAAMQELEDLFTTIDLMDATIAGLQEEMTAGRVTSEQLTQMYIDRIEAYDAKLKLNSVIFINPDALSDAAQLDRERSEGTVRGPLHGIPIIVKANIGVAGMPTSAGSNALVNLIEKEDSFVVKQLKDAGAVILAQTNMSEFAHSSFFSQSTLGGTVGNAYDVSKTPAGSSGGTAVAVTCNFAAAGIGTDTGGSIRNPSSFANLYGIKPSKGLTSITGVFPLKAYKDTVGPMTRTAEDMALLLGIMAGTDTADDYTAEADADALAGSGYMDSLSADALKGMRIGFIEPSFRYFEMSEEEYIDDVPDQKVNAMLKRTFANLRKAGAVLVDISEYLTEETIEEISEDIFVNTFEYDANKFLNERSETAEYKTVKELVNSGNYMTQHLGIIVEDPENLADSFEETVNPYSETTGSYDRLPVWQKILDTREMIAAIMEENDIDAVMYLNCFDVPGNNSFVSESRYNRNELDTILGSTVGLPDVVIPMGFSDTSEEYTSEMPLGLSLFSGYGQDGTLLKIAYAYEQQAGDIIRRMPDQTPALEDQALNAFLTDLIDRAYSIDYSQYAKKPEGKVQLMLSACEKAMDVDTKDPYATYEAARTLAEAYDRMITGLAE